VTFMFDLSAELREFYNKHVRLGRERRQDLADKRDLNLARLDGGLDDLAEETGRARPHPQSWRNQGGYAMHTLNQDPDGNNGYDIDVAVIFAKDDLPADALAARQRVRDALAKRCTGFAEDPEVRTNAVTVWYSQGYHVDFAVYRTWQDQSGRQCIEHASTEWNARGPSAVTDWFQGRVTALSPEANLAWAGRLKVSAGQFRRVVRFAKWFCRSRSGWSLPGGLIVSCLLAEQGVYRPDPERDDRALYNTLSALRDRLAKGCAVTNPVDGSDLTAKPEVLNQVKRLKEKLGANLPKLAVLFDQRQCTRAKARSAWDWVFDHSYWADKEKERLRKVLVESRTEAFPYRVTIRCDLAKRRGGKIYGRYASGSSLLRKGLGLKFSVDTTNVQQPYEVRWEVVNEGDEARIAGQSSWERVGSEIWTDTAFKGRQLMKCQIRQGGQILAESVHVVRIAPGLLGGRWL
jgi:hypothetical protein